MNGHQNALVWVPTENLFGHLSEQRHLFPFARRKSEVNNQRHKWKVLDQIGCLTRRIL